MTFDLTGLPPTPDETDSLLRDPSPDAWDRVVDRLLASPRYGERWGRHWLDLVRYADTNGFEFDEPRPDAWRYRDYVIRSFNDDTPYDRFLTEQLAGDEAYPGNPAAKVATGFHLLGADMTDAADSAQRRQNTLNDTTDTSALAFLGLTLTCARCHDHKFEPISQKDYFRFQAFFTPADFRKDVSLATAAERKVRDAALQTYRDKTKPIRDEIAKLQGPVRQRLTDMKLAKLSEEARLAHKTGPSSRTGGQLELVAQTERLITVTDAEVRKAMPAEATKQWDRLLTDLKDFDNLMPPAEPVAMGVRDRKGLPPKTFLLERGELTNRGDVVEPGYPSILLPVATPVNATIERTGESTGRRLALARWMTSSANPLTARVIVNRVWQHHFGRGLVATASDFGVRGDRPSHPELLDWLASEFVAGKWSLKALHRTILLSETYRQSTEADVATLSADPENRLLAHEPATAGRRIDTRFPAGRERTAESEGRRPGRGDAGTGHGQRRGEAGDFDERRKGTRETERLPFHEAESPPPLPRGFRPTRQQPELPPPRTEHDRPAGLGLVEFRIRPDGEPSVKRPHRTVE